MIQGTVNESGEPVVGIAIGGAFGTRIELDAIVDTGFSEYLTLPTAIIESLGTVVSACYSSS